MHACVCNPSRNSRKRVAGWSRFLPPFSSFKYSPQWQLHSRTVAGARGRSWSNTRYDVDLHHLLRVALALRCRSNREASWHGFWSLDGQAGTWRGAFLAHLYHADARHLTLLLSLFHPSTRSADLLDLSVVGGAATYYYGMESIKGCIYYGFFSLLISLAFWSQGCSYVFIERCCYVDFRFQRKFIIRRSPK